MLNGLNTPLKGRGDWSDFKKAKTKENYTLPAIHCTLWGCHSKTLCTRLVRSPCPINHWYLCQGKKNAICRRLISELKTQAENKGVENDIL